MPIIDKDEISNLKGIGTSMLEATNIKYKYIKSIFITLIKNHENDNLHD